MSDTNVSPAGGSGTLPAGTLKSRFFTYYEKNSTRVDIAFFLGGFVFDVFTLSDIDNPFNIAQQIVYLLITGGILCVEFLRGLNLLALNPRLARMWKYHELAFHFLLGSLLSIYSLFFLKSASLFSSIAFVLLLMGVMVANELKNVHRAQVNVKIGLYVICVFCFFSLLIPVLLGFVGWIPFILATGCTAAFVFGIYNLLLLKVKDQRLLLNRLALPGGAVIALFFLFYLIGWIPPVPLSVQNMGIYHALEKVDGDYRLYHENPSWRFWHSGDQDFQAQPGDRIYFFAQIFSPVRFQDSVFMHFYFKDPRAGWQSTDRVPMEITGGRKSGFRGYAMKENYSPGEWRVSVETTDRREIGRLYFTVTPVPAAARTFHTEVF